MTIILKTEQNLMLVGIKKEKLKENMLAQVVY